MSSHHQQIKLDNPGKEWNRFDLHKYMVRPPALAVYIVLYISVGFINNQIGKEFQIAEFRYWWQVLTCYGMYLIPVSLFLRQRNYLEQYVYGVFFLALCEIAGYTLGSSILYPHNLFDQIFGIHNVTLGMVFVFGSIPPIGNLLVQKICSLLKIDLELGTIPAALQLK